MSEKDLGKDDLKAGRTAERRTDEATAADWPARAERRRRRRRRRRVTTALGVLSLGIAASLFAVTQTRPGRDLVFSYLEGALQGRIRGEVEIGSVLRGNLLTRVVLERFAIRGADGTPFVDLDTVRLEYDPFGLVRGQLRFRSMDAARAEIVLRELPDGAWNFERIFGDTIAASGEPAPVEEIGADSMRTDSIPADSVAAAEEPPGEDTEGLRLIFADVAVRGGRLEIRRPWTEGLESRARAAALREARGGEAIWQLLPVERESGEEYEQVFAVDSLHGAFPMIRILDAPRPLRVEMRGLTGRLEAVRQPLDVQRYDGSVTFGDSIRVDFDHLQLGSSALAGAGWVVPGSPLAYEFDLAARPAGFADLQWLPVPVPADGGGPMDITIRSRGDVMVVDIEDGEVTSGDTRVSGGFSLALERTPRFESLALDLTQLRLRWLDRLLERPELIDGYVRGRVTGSGRIDALQIDAEVQLADVDASVPASGLRAVGGVALVEPYPTRDLNLTFSAFEPRWAEYLGLATGLPGRVDGTATLDRAAAGALGFRGEIRHTGEDGDVSNLSGGGALDLETGSAINMSVFADPLALSLLRPFLPDAGLVGTVSGPIRASGGLSDLQASADLETPRGRLRFNGRFDVTADDPTYDVEVVADGIELEQWIETAPSSKLAVRGQVTGRGLDPATLAASFDLEILPSVFEQAQIDTSLVHFTVADGLAVIDTFAIRSDVGRIQGRGEFGLSEEASGELVLEATVPDLTAWNRWVLDEIPGAAAQEGAEDLFADLAIAVAGTHEDAPIEGLAGAFEARGIASGNLSDFTARGFVTATVARYESLAADALEARVEIEDPLVRDSLTVDLSGTGVDLFGYAIDSLSIRFRRRGPGPAELAVDARRDSTLSLSSSGTIERGEGMLALGLDRLRLLVGSGESVLQEPARLSFGDAGVSVERLRMTGSLGELDADGTIPATEAGHLDVRVSALELGQLARLLSDPPALSGSVEGEIGVSGTIDDPTMRGEVHVHVPVLGETEYDSLEARFDYAGRRLDGELILLDANRRLAVARGAVRADLALRGIERRLLEDPFDFEIRADSLPLEMVLLPVGSLEEIDGWVEAAVRVTGAPGSLQYEGEARVVDGTAWVPDLGVRYRSAEGEARFRGSEARVEAFRVVSRLGGRATLSGTIDFASVTDPVFDLDLSAERLHAIDRRDMTVTIDGRGHLGGTYRAPILVGRYRIRDGDIRQDEFLRERQVIDLGDPSIFSLIDTTGVAGAGQLGRFRNPFMRNLKVSAVLDLGPNLWLRSDVLGVEMVGEGLTVEMDRAAQSLVMIGTVQLARGTYRFDRLPPYSQQLRITEGTIQFVGNPDLNPNIAITAEYRTRTRDGPVVVRTHIGGTLRATELTLSSSPPMSDSNQLCFLAIGAPCYGAADQRFGERLVQEGVLGTLSTGLSSAFVGSSGLSYFNLRSVEGPREATAGTQGSQSLFDNTELEVGWYAGEEIFFAVTQPLGGGVPSAALEWRFTENWTLEARAQSRFDQQQYGLFRGTNIANDQTFGLFLFREWTF